MSDSLKNCVKGVLITPKNNNEAPLIDVYLSLFVKLDDDKFKSFSIGDEQYDFIYKDFRIGDDLLPSLLVLKHFDNGYFYDMNTTDFNKIADYFTTKSLYDGFLDKYDFLPYSFVRTREYEINIRELLERTVSVKASSLQDALNKVTKMYKEGDIVLDAEDFKEKNISSLDDDFKYYKYASEVDLDTLENGKSARVLIPSFDGEMKWEDSPSISHFSLDDNHFKISYYSGLVLTNDIDLIINNESPFVICKDQQTKDWYVYNDKTDQNESINGETIYFNNEFEAKDWCMNQITKGDYSVSQKHQKHVMSRR